MTDYLRVFLAWGLIWVLPISVIVFALFIITTMAHRRRERARLFLDLLQVSLDDGKGIEVTVVELSATRDRIFPARFHLLAAYVEQGLSFPKALLFSGSYLPGNVRAVLQAGLVYGDAKRVVSAAFDALGENALKVQTQLNYAFVLLMIVTPASLLLLPFWRIAIWPKMAAIWDSMVAENATMGSTSIAMPALTLFLTNNAFIITFAYFAAIAVLFAAILLYLVNPVLGTPRFGFWRRITDSALLWLPWLELRCFRTFSIMLGTFLDSGLKEEEAMRLAAASTNNISFERRIKPALNSLAEGRALDKALESIEPTGEFSWRLSNALRSRSGFLQALSGWHETLEARATRAEEVMAHACTTAFVLLNGVLIGTIVVSVFLLFVTLLNEAVLW